MNVKEIIEHLRSKDIMENPPFQKTLAQMQEKRHTEYRERRNRMFFTYVGLFLLFWVIVEMTGFGLGFIISLLIVIVIFAVRAILSSGRSSLVMKPDDIKKLPKYVVLSHICPQFNFSYETTISKKDIDRFFGLSLIPVKRTKRIIKIEDKIMGTIDDREFQIIQLVLQNEWAPFVLLLSTRFKKNFNGTTIVTSEQKRIGHETTRLINIGDPVTLEDGKFNNIFTVSSTDQIEARYLMTPNFIESTQKVYEMPHVGNFRLAFHEDEILLSVQSEKNYFDSNPDDISSKEYVRSVIDDLAFIFEMIEELGMMRNTKV